MGERSWTEGDVIRKGGEGGVITALWKAFP